MESTTSEDLGDTEIIDETDHEGAREPVEAQEPQEEATEPAEPSLSREAAKYRTRARDAETERDTLAAQVEALQRSEVGRIAGAVNVKTEALWAAGTQLSDLLTEVGAVDEKKVASAIDNAVATLGISRKPRPNTAPKEGTGGEHPGGLRDGWQDAFMAD